LPGDDPRRPGGGSVVLDDPRRPGVLPPRGTLALRDARGHPALARLSRRGSALARPPLRAPFETAPPREHPGSALFVDALLCLGGRSGSGVALLPRPHGAIRA